MNGQQMLFEFSPSSVSSHWMKANLFLLFSKAFLIVSWALVIWSRHLVGWSVTLTLTYASWFLVEQRAATTPLQRTRFWLVLFSSAHVVLTAFISASLLRQICFGQPTSRFPCRFQSRACLVMLDAGFHSVWPIQPHLRFLISVSTGEKGVWSSLLLLLRQTPYHKATEAVFIRDAVWDFDHIPQNLYTEKYYSSLTHH